MTFLIEIAVVTACICAIALTASYVYKVAFQLGIEQHKTSVELALKIQEAKKSAYSPVSQEVDVDFDVYQ